MLTVPINRYRLYREFESRLYKVVKYITYIIYIYNLYNIRGRSKIMFDEKLALESTAYELTHGKRHL